MTVSNAVSGLQVDLTCGNPDAANDTSAEDCVNLTSDPTQVFTATVTGVVTDSSGAVLPGVTVEAASPALIEKVRTTVSDGSGQYRIIDLRPGTYTVTFTLPGFTTVKRDGLELTGRRLGQTLDYRPTGSGNRRT